MGYTIASFIFEQLILHDFVSPSNNFESMRKNYLDNFINEMKQWDS